MRTQEETLAKFSQISDDYEYEPFRKNTLDYTQVFDKEDAAHLLAIFDDTSVFFDEEYDEGKLGYIRYIQAFRALIQLKEEKIVDIYCEITPKTDFSINDWFWEDYSLLINTFPEKGFQTFLDICSLDISKINENNQYWFVKVFSEADKLYLHPEISEEQKLQIENLVIDVMKYGLKEQEFDLIDENEDIYHNIREINGFGLSVLMDIHLTEKYYGFIKELFEADLIDEGVAGDLEDLEIHLGMREERETPRRANSTAFNQLLEHLENENGEDDSIEVEDESQKTNFTNPSKQDKKKKKDKRKAQKKARKQNRKK